MLINPHECLQFTNDAACTKGLSLRTFWWMASSLICETVVLAEKGDDTWCGSNQHAGFKFWVVIQITCSHHLLLCSPTSSLALCCFPCLIDPLFLPVTFSLLTSLGWGGMAPGCDISLRSAIDKSASSSSNLCAKLQVALDRVASVEKHATPMMRGGWKTIPQELHDQFLIAIHNWKKLEYILRLTSLRPLSGRLQITQIFHGAWFAARILLFANQLSRVSTKPQLRLMMLPYCLDISRRGEGDSLWGANWALQDAGHLACRPSSASCWTETGALLARTADMLLASDAGLSQSRWQGRH